MQFLGIHSEFFTPPQDLSAVVSNKFIAAENIFDGFPGGTATKISALRAIKEKCGNPCKCSGSGGVEDCYSSCALRTSNSGESYLDILH